MVVRFDRRSLFVPYLAVGFWVVDGRGSRESVWPLGLRRGTHVLTVRQYIWTVPRQAHDFQRNLSPEPYTETTPATL